MTTKWSGSATESRCAQGKGKGRLAGRSRTRLAGVPQQLKSMFNRGTSTTLRVVAQGVCVCVCGGGGLGAFKIWPPPSPPRQASTLQKTNRALLQRQFQPLSAQASAQHLHHGGPATPKGSAAPTPKAGGEWQQPL